MQQKNDYFALAMIAMVATVAIVGIIALYSGKAAVAPAYEQKNIAGLSYEDEYEDGGSCPAGSSDLCSSKDVGASCDFGGNAGAGSCQKRPFGSGGKLICRCIKNTDEDEEAVAI